MVSSWYAAAAVLKAVPAWTWAIMALAFWLAWSMAAWVSSSLGSTVLPSSSVVDSGRSALM